PRPEGGLERAAGLVHGHGMQRELNLLADLGVAEAAGPHDQVAGEPAEAVASRDAVAAHGVPHAHAADRHLAALAGRGAGKRGAPLLDPRVDGRALGVAPGIPPGLLLELGELAIELPMLLRRGDVVREAGDAQEPRQGARRVGAAREAEQVDLVARLV